MVFKSSRQLIGVGPHPGSQKSPGHQCGGGAGSAWAGLAEPKPANPKPAAITAVAAAAHMKFFMPILLLRLTVYGIRQRLFSVVYQHVSISLIRKSVGCK